MEQSVGDEAGGCFGELKLVKPLALLLGLSLLGLVGWVAADHVAFLKDNAASLPGSGGLSLGLQLVTPDELVARMFAFPPGEAVLVDKVLNNSPAQRAGLRQGDGIVAINGRSIRSTADASAYLDQVKRGDLLKLTVIRGGLVHYFLLPTGNRPNG